ncbi:MAG: phospholipase D family protein [Chloroflexi bacterium]|nr:phospholipase D family protein [Chloroflexota bacterium]
MRLLWSPWKDDLFQLLSGARASVDLAVAYMSLATVSELLEVLPDRVRLRVLTRIDDRDFTSGVADPETFRLLATHHPGNLRVMPNLHAKLYIVDEQTAILGSGNLTPPGLGGDGKHNEEAGLLVDDPSLISEMCDRWNEWWQQATPVDDHFVHVLSEEVAQLPKRPQGSTKIKRAISDLMARARMESGMGLLFNFSFPVGEMFLNCGERHVMSIPNKHIQLVHAERLTEIDSVDVLLPDGSIMRGSIQLTHDRERPRHRIRVYHDHSCTIRDHLRIGQMLRVEVSRGNGTVRVDLRLEEGG